MTTPSGSPRGRAAAWTLAGLLLLLAGCVREAPDVQAVRKVSDRYLRALVRKDVDEARRLATNVVPMTSVVGGRVLAVGPAEPGRLAVLDSLLDATDRQRRSVDSLWTRAREEEADSLFHRLRLLNRRRVVVRCAQRAAQASLPETLIGGSAGIELRRVRVLIRYAGERVGPRPVDREMSLRLLRAGRGGWIVFSLYLPADDPFPRLD